MDDWPMAGSTRKTRQNFQRLSVCSQNVGGLSGGV